MDMSLTMVYVDPWWPQKWLVLFCLLWPLMAWSLVPRRGRSSAPLAAMLVPLALSVGLMWLSLSRCLYGMVVSGGGIESVSAGIAEALFVPFVGAFAAGGVAIITLIRRHRPTADTPIVMLYTLTIAEVASALLFRPRMAAVDVQLTFCYGAAILAGLVAFAAFVRAWLAARGRTSAPARRYGVAFLSIATVVTGFAISQQIDRWTFIAFQGR